MGRSVSKWLRSSETPVGSGHSSRVAVLVPTHLERLDATLEEVLLHNARMLRRYHLEVILPETCSPTWYESLFEEHRINGCTRLVKSEYFGSTVAVNRMGTDVKFYKMYEEYDYVLICHLDALILGDQLDAWLAAGYDFIGAPLFLPDVGRGHFLRRMAPFGANGGLSLRKVDACIRVLETFKPRPNLVRIFSAVAFLARNRRFDLMQILLRLLNSLRKDWRGTCEKYNIYEDVFFTVIAPLLGAKIRIPSSSIAKYFACEVNFELLQKEVLVNTIPFGVHGYDKYVASDYLAYIKSISEYRLLVKELNRCENSPFVSVVMIVKNLIVQRRLECFESAITSVLQQSYTNFEIVIVDGGSTDATQAILRSRYGSSPGVRIFVKPDRSVWEAMANGVAFSKGDLIAFMNSDDCYRTPYALELLVARLVKTGADWAYGNTMLTTETGSFPFPTHLPSVLNCFGVVHQATIFKKAIIQAINPFGSGHVTAENYLFVATLMAGFKVCAIKEYIVDYRVGGLSTTMYSGENYESTVSDYLTYMKKLTSIGLYLNDDEIRGLYGFRTAADRGFVSYARSILKIKDRRLRNLLIQGCWNQLRSRGLFKVLKNKIQHMLR
ncbi:MULTISPECIES: DUF5672 family protein [unclassified Bradyrhizobium]|uniref:DUF5672 family protein n=1 Tax=unclassified Bradyrhizobium TaxID=2631580 RepID=UPI001FF8F8ED|nr:MULTISPECIES: DUF5672 family protein [unclassified Bradyrhizobium]MCK1534629.1 glycosyltransferase [Bradyrhizobium sp. 176]MCK1557866.1 glycosyltransferase [Bradyrhizobium sp. 171]UPJ98283.1 glycosyltransferase [Bradyrhizobium sp. 172]